jgi:hypothetical protein
MLIADGGGGYGGTDWMAMDVIQMWQAIQNQDTTAHYQILAGWRKSYELTLEHLSHVQSYRQNLAEAWPPEKSPASAAYLQRLDDLIANLQSTYDAAVANHDAFASATLAISLSRTDVEKIYNEYTSNQAKLEEFKNRPYVAAGKSAVPPQKPPVADGRQEQLNNQARSIMYGLSSEIIQARNQITKPPLYDVGNVVDAGRKDDNGPGYVPPPIPPVHPYYPDSASSSGTTGRNFASTQATNPTAGPTTTPPSTIRQPGLILGGIQPTPTPPPPVTGIVPPPSLGTGPLPNVITPTPIFTPTPLGPPGGLPPGFGVTRSLLGEGLGRAGIARPPSGMRAMPPGGVIGGEPGIGLGQPGAGTRPASRVNPVGGVINPNNSTARSGPAGRGTTASGPSLGTTGRSGGRLEESDDNRRWDPDNPWETADGVAPVVLPEAEQRVDPGPAIGLG